MVFHLASENQSNMWQFEQNLTKSPSWLQPTPPPDLGWGSQKTGNNLVAPPKINGDIDEDVRSPETLQSLLERLSLSNHLYLFQVKPLILWFC